MKVIIADHAGFCSGVKRAVKMTNQEISKDNEALHSYGPLIHNAQAVKEFEDRGLKTISNMEQAEKDGRIIIRSHGIARNLEEEMRYENFQVIDTTCPYVKVVHKRVEKFTNEGYNIVIIGDAEHPEVIGINSYSKNQAFIVNSLEDVERLEFMDKLCIVSQTTNTKEKFDLLTSKLKEKAEIVKIFNTICRATSERQDSAMNLAKEVDAMIVIGGYHSSNTRKLYEVCKNFNENVFHIEKVEELALQELAKFNTIGITAGASTPDWIIEEVVGKMDNLNNNEMMEAIESSFTRIQRGDIVDGQVIFVTDNEVMVNINYKSDGIITREELANDSDLTPKDLYKEGDQIQVYILRVDDGEGNVVLSTRRVEEAKNWDVLEENFENQDELEATVIRVVNGGLIAKVNDINGFVPASHSSAEYVADLNKFVGESFKVRILDFNRQKRRVILSRKVVEKEELEEKREALWASLEEGIIVEGTVQRLTDFGAFVDLGSVDGLIHISDLSWHRVRHPSEVVSPGDKVEVQILSFDKEKNRISLGLKQTIEEPWVVFEENCKIGDQVEGEVVNLLDFGAFIRLEDGVDGLLHVSQISNEHVDKPSDVLEIGQTVSVRIIDINSEDRRISLSMRDPEEKKEEVAKEVKEVEKEENKEGYIENEDMDVTIGDMLDNK